MTKPLKEGGWLQGLYEISATEKEMVGTLRMDLWGNKYRYAKAGSTGLDAGKLVVAPAMDTDVENEDVATDAAIGDKTVYLTITSTTIDEDYFRGGTLQVNDATGEGHRYTILHSSAVSAGTAITVTLDDPLQVALVAGTSECTLMHSPWMEVVVSDGDQTHFPAGVPMKAVTADYYFWCQTRGDAPVLADEAAGKGSMLTIGDDTNGSVEAVDAVAEVVVGVAREALTDTEYGMVYLTID